MTASPTIATLPLRVAEARALNPLIRLLRLEHAEGAALPGWTPGAHIQVQVQLPDGQSDWRHYSLIDFHGVAGTPGFAPADYTIAVRLEEGGRGGSRFVHQGLKPGDSVTVQAPRNDFPLDEGTARAVLLAGGIGITPLASMAARCRAQGRPVALHYAGRSRTLLAFADELQALLGADLRLHADDEAGGAGFDIGTLLDGMAADEPLYVCGPKPLLDAVLAATQARGWAAGRVHFELFSAPVVEAGDQPFEVELAQSGRRFTVPADQTILDCLIEHGCDPLYDCKRGECGVCAVPVIEGEIDHRDYVLSQAEKDGGQVMQICISRAKGPRLVIDL
ncbi:vanillate O-demethylase ferredoxin subunit [Pseudacidovorax intermedius]|uniref:Vanillate O-demethylase ferredoxin subunit n=1 Tax=Pseudacidovorax intermedius TaxID=433924 RepID=A0A370FJD2_9BURK|nr:PDR/VanB family oxidoreductase [Pseudacidovorax intermedius]RDI25239.1 vanillate O-demethylase ferredoxin subunit [Pseudacidovorax intermedius]